MSENAAHSARLLLIDSNVLFARRLSDALKHEGFEVAHTAQSAYALTMLEWNPPDGHPVRHQSERNGSLRNAASIIHSDANNRARSPFSPWARAATGKP